MMIRLMRWAAGFLVATLSLQVLAAGEIRMVSVRSNACAPVSGCFATPFFSAVVEVQNLAYAKQVGVRYRNAAGQWVNQAGEYMFSTPGNREAWRIPLDGPSSAFAFYYTVNGVTYWDNNGGKNYSLAPYQYDGLLGDIPVGSPTGALETGGIIRGEVLVKNLAYHKQVKVVYTLNNWQTASEVPARFLKTLPSGVEMWSYEVSAANVADITQVKMAFFYDWGVGSAWDNAFGRNYAMRYFGLLTY